MANEAEAIKAVADRLDAEYKELVDLMNDLADGSIWRNGSYDNRDQWKENPYNIGGIKINGDSTGDRENAVENKGTQEATQSGKMMTISIAATNQGIFTSQLADGITRIPQMKKALSQKLG